MFIVIKNTFLEFLEEDLETQRHKRSSSLPPRNDARWRSEGFNMASGSRNTSQVISTKVAPHGGEDQQASCLKRSIIRPCKARRDKFRKFVETLKQKLIQDPDAFSLDKITVPKSLVWDERTHLKVVKLLADFRREHIDCRVQTPSRF